MAATYYLVKHMADPRRQEPRNVGVIVESCGTYASNFVGLDQATGHVDGRKLRQYNLAADVLSAWIDYIGDHLSVDRFERLLTYRERKPASLWVEHAGNEYTEIESPMSFSAQLFNDLVVTGTSEAEEPSMKQRIESIFEMAHVRFRKRHIMQGKFSDDSEPVDLDFGYGVENREALAFDFTGARGFSKSLELRSKIAAVRHIERSAEFAVFFSGSEHEEDLDHFLAPIEQEAHTINIDDATTASETVHDLAASAH